MRAEGPGLLLDVTRLSLRAGRSVLTGVDRVERAYVVYALERPGHIAFLLRHRGRLHLLDRQAGAQLLRWCDGAEDAPERPAIGRLLGRGPAASAAPGVLARTAAASGRAIGDYLGRMLTGGLYLNVGHSNLDASTFASVPGLRLIVMIHDTIPLDHPEFSAPAAPARFQAAFRAAIKGADRILCPTASVGRDVARWAATFGAAPDLQVAPVGVTPPPIGVAPDVPHPFCLALGTIEPRKNHALLLDLWERAPPGLPALVIVGRRGWADAALLRRIERSPLRGRSLFLFDTLGDGAVGALLRHAVALLAPSRAEGFGLPPAEAAMLGTPVLATDLAVTREVLGDYPTYLPPDDPVRWHAAILGLTANTAPRRQLQLPGWTDHFNLVFNPAG